MGTLFRAHHNSRDEPEFNHHCSVPSSGSLNEGCSDVLGFSGMKSVHDSQAPSEGETMVEGDYFDGVFKYIQQMLMEEDDLEYIPYMFQDCMALQAAEKSFYDALTENPPPPPPPHSGNRNVQFSIPDNQPFPAQFPLPGNQTFQTGLQELQPGYNPFPEQVQIPMIPMNNSSGSMFGNQFSGEPIGNGCSGGSNGRRNRNREDGGEGRQRSKQMAAGNSDQEPEKTEKYDKALLCPSMNPLFYDDSIPYLSDESSETEARDKKYLQGPKRGRPRGSKKGAKPKQIVDLTDLLARCAQAEAAHDKKNFDHRLAAIRQHSSQFGDAAERLAHCFANAVEARAAGTGTSLYASITRRRMSAAEYLKAYQTYITACPFKRMSNIYANKSIAKLTRESEKIHIIDFGILYGFQWPCIIHGISLRPGGPPQLRITGIDFPQPGFRPAERIEETGRRLENFARRFNVPFQYTAIAKKWEEITPEDLNIQEDEILVANCLYRMKNVPDETLMENNSPRDDVLKLIKKINPQFFVHGIVNGMYNAPFFTTRFREAYFHFSALFDMFEATMPREDEGRLLAEQELLGRDVLNVIACEGRERVERPETYKQWQMRTQRAGFRALPLHREIIKEVKEKTRMGYHRDFSVEEDGEWMLQSWKGRVIYAMSLWQPLHN
ncbi:PREDICTED: scarecrow-like protein 11 [Ipomoea nil]|uniref:scarecrow-like protein 11 n=1 Tax=Ipomoea nil TaxID=35883 RepID=UPI0009013CC4|nr:PREDICTED: scarecrow-like protein 11 [Ipomoea nil]